MIFVLYNFITQSNVVPLVEGEWQNADRTGLHPASRADLITVLSKLDSILVRATLKESVSQTSISDVFLETAVQQNTRQRTADEVEECVCPPGYRGTSCEVIHFDLILYVRIY